VYIQNIVKIPAIGLYFSIDQKTEKFVSFLGSILIVRTKGVGRKFPGRGATEKTRPKYSTIRPPSILLVPCMKIQGGHGPPAPRCRRPWSALVAGYNYVPYKIFFIRTSKF